MPKVILGLVAIVAVAGWATAFAFFTKSEDLATEVETSVVERAELTEALELTQKDLEKHIESAGRLDEIDQQLSAAKDQVATLEGQIQVKRDELIVVSGEIESSKAELATLESSLRERKAAVRETEQETERARIERDNLRAEAEELRRKAELTQSELLAEPPLEPSTTSEVEAGVAEAKDKGRVTEARRRFQIVDQNRDDRVDQGEFRLKSVTLLILLDINGDDFVTIDETLLPPEKFKLFDFDGDGKISQVEFVDTRTFHTIDTNRQGFITFKEYLAFIQATAN